MSLDRLIDLAKRTGDRLIVHNPADGSNLVIMDVCDYEVLVGADYGQRDVRKMSGEQLVDQINRDIAIWRSDRSINGGWVHDDVDDSCEGCEGCEDFFVSGDYDSELWHDTSEILGDKFGSYFEKNNDEDFDNDFYEHDDITDDDDIDDVFNTATFEPMGGEYSEKDRQSNAVSSVDFEPNFEPQFNYVPARHHLDVSASSLEWEEDFTDDDPVFLEEPISF